MKKLTALLLSFLLLCSCAALAEPAEEESAPLTKEELEIYLNDLGAAALGDESTTVDTLSSGDHYADFFGGTLKISDEELTETTAILGVYPSDGQADSRGIYLGDGLDKVLRAYPNDNPQLAGSYYDAVLYISGEKPEVSTGFVLREGQQVTEVVHTVYSWQPEGVETWVVYYIMEDGMVMGMYAGATQMMEEEEALESIQEIADMQEISEYFAYPLSETGEGLAPFSREDLGLLIDGQITLDLLDLTAQEAIEYFGPAPVDEWTQDSDGAFLRLMQWDGISLLLKCDGEKQFVSVDSLTVNDNVLDGPRGVRVGDKLDSVLFRFLHGEVFTAEDTVTLYGDGENAPFGVLTYTPESAELTYALALEEGKNVIWHMTFVGGELQTMSLLLR